MVRLHLVGFTTDLKNLIFADERGAKAGGYVVSVDSRLRNTLEEVARLGQEAEYEDEDYESYELTDVEPEAEPEPAPPPRVKVDSKLTPKEIQHLLRQGKSEEQVARLAGTKVDWIKRFSFAILAERQDVIDAVKAARLSKPRLGPSAMTIGEAVEENIGAKRIRMTPQEMDDAWKAVRKNGRWHVSFEYQSRGQKRLARYSFDPSNRMVEPLNEIALELGWRTDSSKKPSSPSGAPSPRVSGSIVKPTAARSSASPARATGAQRPSARPAAGAARTGSRAAPPADAATPRRPRSTSSSRVSPAGRSAVQSREPEASVRPTSSRSAAKPPRQNPGNAKPPSPLPGSAPPERAAYRPREMKVEPEPYSSLPRIWRPSRRP